MVQIFIVRFIIGVHKAHVKFVQIDGTASCMTVKFIFLYFEVIRVIYFVETSHCKLSAAISLLNTTTAIYYSTNLAGLSTDGAVDKLQV